MTSNITWPKTSKSWPENL